MLAKGKRVLASIDGSQHSRGLRMVVLYIFAAIGAVATLIGTYGLGLILWFAWIEHIRNKPKTLKQLKRQWEAIAVEEH